MSVVTIRGQLGSGAPDIGRKVAHELHADYVDREIIAAVAAQLDGREQDVLKKEMPRAGLWGRIEDALTQSPAFTTNAEIAYTPIWQIPLDDSRYLKSLESVIKKLAERRGYQEDT